MSTDCNFPIIKYLSTDSSTQRGILHGEEFRSEIKELVQIRRDLMLKKNPTLKNHLKTLALEQYEISKRFSSDLSHEFDGICKGSNTSIEDLVILNNYTDFRDIQLPNQGCSTVSYIDENICSVGQTWDMHSSAKDYLSIIEIENRESDQKQIVLSLVGCLGLMGVNNQGIMIGVNNINTKNAKSGLIWSYLVREILNKKNFKETKNLLINAPVTSGHNYLISDGKESEHWEITPEYQERVEKQSADYYFHTNHCLTENVKSIEDTISSNSTTHERYKILEESKERIHCDQDIIELLKSHEKYPKSICSHFQANAQDPSSTCGGGVMNYNTGEFHLWRGCKVYDSNYKEYSFKVLS